MRIDTILDAVEERLKADELFSNINIIKAYPCSAAPSRLSRETLALGLDEIKVTPASVDDINKTGEISVFADIFIPLKTTSSRAFEILTALCSCMDDFNVLSVSAQRIAVDRDTASYVLKTVFTFRDEIEVI